jgi:hypothetical protein
MNPNQLLCFQYYNVKNKAQLAKYTLNAIYNSRSWSLR